MSRIKSAIEIAMERAGNVEGDKGKLEEYTYVTKGKNLAAQFLRYDLDAKQLQKAFKDCSKNCRQYLRKGFREVLQSNISLSGDISLLVKRLELLKEGFLALDYDKKSVELFFQQLKDFYEQYIQNKEALKQQVLAQMSSHLQQKQQKMAQQFGEGVELDPMADPEFLQVLHQNENELTAQYEQALGNVKAEITDIFPA